MKTLINLDDLKYMQKMKKESLEKMKALDNMTKEDMEKSHQEFVDYFELDK